MKISGKHLKLASTELVQKITGAKIGYAGLVDLSSEIEIFMDESCDNRKNFEMGTNKTGYHSINLNFGRDIPKPQKFYDIKIVEQGDLYPETGEVYEVSVSAEVGNIFKLGTKYSEAFDLNYLDQENQTKKVIMGCHGIGITRCMAVIAETSSDEKGLKWPESVAPFKFHLVTIINPKDDEEIQNKILDLAQKIYRGELTPDLKNSVLTQIELTNSNQKLNENVLWDDRPDISFGQKVTEAELIGCPWILILTKKSLENGGIEVKNRFTGETSLVKL